MDAAVLPREYRDILEVVSDAPGPVRAKQIVPRIGLPVTSGKIEGTRAKPKSQVPVWRQGLAWSALSVDYQRILTALADRARLGQGPMTCQELATGFGMGLVPARVEALRSKAKRLVARGWAVEPAPGRFTLTQGVSGPGGGS